jgi:cytidylate kinase
MKHNEINIAIDGYSSCGKSSIAKDISRNFNMIYVDSGAMYRAVTLFCLENNIIENKKVNEIKLIDSLNTIDIKYNYNKSLNVSEIFLNGENVEKKIRNKKVSNYVSKVSQIAQVRSKLIKIQQEICANKNVVMDGRDIATKVMPNAELKFFITANIETRAKRRFDELKKTDCLITFDEVLNNLNDRDSDDVNRSINPLIKSNDAIVIDNTSLNFAQQNKLIFNYIHDATN